MGEPKAALNVGKAFKGYGKVLAKNPSNYRIVAIQKGGAAAASANVHSNGTFKIGLKDQTVKGTTLQLITQSGKYKGPIVAQRGTKAATQLSGVRSGNLGSLSVGDGFAVTSRTEAFNRNVTVPFSKRNGTPGSGKLGLVEIIDKDGIVAHGGSSFSPGQFPGLDADDDGIPNLVDVDDDGDLILDSADSDFNETKNPKPYVFNDLPVDLSDAINVNAGTAITDEIIDNFIKTYLHLVIGFNTGNLPGITLGDANVDCLTLPYCGKNGVATIAGVGGISLPAGFPLGQLWNSYDPDNDGLPNLYNYPNGDRREIIISPNVTTQEISPGDTLLVKIILNGLQKTFPMVLSSVYATVPAIKTLSDGASTTTVNYPSTNSSPGARNNPIQLQSNNVTLTFWRPQRRAIPGAEPGDLIDMGKLKYSIDLGSTNFVVLCDGDDYSNLSPTLTPSQNFGSTALFDSSIDAAPDSSKTLSFTVNLSSCLSRAGKPVNEQSLIVGLKASDSSGNNAKQLIYLKTP